MTADRCKKLTGWLKTFFRRADVIAISSIIIVITIIVIFIMIGSPVRLATFLPARL